MTQSMNIRAERVQAILEAYGAHSARWPEAERAACNAFLAAHPDAAKAWLAEAREMDALLGLLKGEATDQRLHEAVLASLPEHSATILAFKPRTKAKRALPLIWATGVGLAACLAGAAVGANLSMTSMQDIRAQSVLEQVQLADTENGI